MLSQKIHTYTHLKTGRLYGSTYEPKRNMENSVSRETEAVSEVFELEDWENFLCNAFSVLSRSSCVQLFATPWMVAHQAPLLMGFSRQEYWSGLPFPTPGDLPNPVIKPMSPTLWGVSLPSELQGKPITFRMNRWEYQSRRLFHQIGLKENTLLLLFKKQ